MSLNDVKRDDALEALAARVKAQEFQLKETSSKLDEVTNLLRQVLTSQKDLREGVSVPGNSSGAGFLPPVESKNSQAAPKASLTADQQARLALLESKAFETQAAVLGASKSQQKALSDALHLEQVSSAAVDAGAAGVLSSMLVQHQASMLSTATKLKDLSEAKSFPELQKRLTTLALTSAASATPAFRSFLEQHIAILADLNETKVFPAVKYYHYAVFNDRDKAEREGPDQLERFYLICGTGHSAYLTTAKSAKYHDRGGGGGRGRGRGRGRGTFDHRGGHRGGSFRGRGGAGASSEGAGSV